MKAALLQFMQLHPTVLQFKRLQSVYVFSGAVGLMFRLHVFVKCLLFPAQVVLIGLHLPAVCM